MGSNREKSNIAIAILEKLTFLNGNKNYDAFDGSNNIFTDCMFNNIRALKLKVTKRHFFLFIPFLNQQIFVVLFVPNIK